jgi:hypothetical protein
MTFDSTEIMALLATWKSLGYTAIFVAGAFGAYIYDRKTGSTLQVFNKGLVTN